VATGPRTSSGRAGSNASGREGLRTDPDAGSGTEADGSRRASNNVRDSSTSSNPAQAGASASQNNPSAPTMSPATHETSTSTSSVPPPAAVSLQINVDLLVHSGTQGGLSSASPEQLQVLDDITGPSLLTDHRFILFPNISLHDTSYHISCYFK
jgi:hypothetical protein